MLAELLAHRRQHLGTELKDLTRGEARIQDGRQHWHRYPLIDRRAKRSTDLPHCRTPVR